MLYLAFIKKLKKTQTILTVTNVVPSMGVLITLKPPRIAHDSTSIPQWQDSRCDETPQYFTTQQPQQGDKNIAVLVITALNNKLFLVLISSNNSLYLTCNTTILPRVLCDYVALIGFRCNFKVYERKINKWVSICFSKQLSVIFIASQGLLLRVSDLETPRFIEMTNQIK